MRKFRAVPWLMASVLALAGCANVQTPVADYIVIGMDEDSTGPGASYATIAGSTVRATIDKLNAEGGIAGKQVRLVVENDESSPTNTPSIIRKIVDQGASAIILATGSGSALQAKQVSRSTRIPTIAPIALTDAVANAPDNEYAYMVPNPLAQYAEVYCGAFEQQGKTRLGIVADSSPAISGILATLSPKLTECIEIVSTQKAAIDTADLTASVSRLLEYQPDVVLVASVGGNFELMAQNTLHRLAPGVQRFSLASIGNQPKSWALAQPGSLDGLVYMGSLAPDNPRTAELQDWLRTIKGPDYSVTAYDAQAYDSVMLIKRAIEIAGTHTDPELLNSAFQQIQEVPATFGQSALTLSLSPEQHIAPDSVCGLVLIEFGPNNQPTGPWPEYQPDCGNRKDRVGE
ncbi:ABC transporter substrate-binding protein [Rhodococcus sp. 1163]|uniref:ABC transporter substrate-binding protein n=1 Tax=unclassified Rhodococcus (in: high G+C Gram-positive bacteria) TaxID=192944 RepID=UPI0009FD4D9D|nr:ABC transporter substrate-binding protein [Rhodococcus sp. 1163]ORI19018.1 ABC transporter substrate-binding protein [Rhodococcus sp. 1163]